MRRVIAGAMMLAVAGCNRFEGQPAPIAQGPTGSLESALAAAATSAGVEARRVWAEPTTDFAGGPSPDGTLLSFTDWANMSLAVRDLRTGENRVIASPTAGTSEFPEYSRFSPDGKQVVYNWFNGQGWELRVVGVDGSAPRVLVPNTPEGGYMQPGAWTPDGEHILTGVFPSDGTFQFALVNAATGAKRVLRSYSWTESPNGIAAISPDGRHIAIGERSKSDRSKQALVILTMDGTHLATVAAADGMNTVLGWGTDGRLFYRSSRGATQTAYAIPMRNGKPVGAPQLLRTDFGRAFPMAITRDGRLFYGELAGTLDVYAVSLDPATGRMMSPLARATHRLLGFNQGIDWTADGRFAAYLVRKGSAPASEAVFAIRDEETGDVRELDPSLAYINAAIRWSPDGRSILAQGRDSLGRTGLHLIDSRTGGVTAIFYINPKGGMVHKPSWAPDGRTIYYALSDVDHSTPDYRIMRRNLDSGEEREVFAAPKLSIQYALAEDGKSIAVVVPSSDKVSLGVVGAEGGQFRELVSVPAKQYINSVTWSRDGRHIYYSHVPDPTTMEARLWRIAVSGGEPEQLDLAMANMSGLRFHPDGRRLGFTAGDVKPEVWVLESGSSSAPATRAVGAAR